MFNHIRERCINRIDSEIEILESYYQKFPETRELIDYLCKDFEDRESKEIQQQIKMLIYGLTRYTMNSHYPDFFNSITTFIGNFILDDADFIVKDDCFGYKVLETDFYNGIQDPSAIIEAAKFNVEKIKKEDEKYRG